MTEHDTDHVEDAEKQARLKTLKKILDGTLASACDEHRRNTWKYGEPFADQVFARETKRAREWYDREVAKMEGKE